MEAEKWGRRIRAFRKLKGFTQEGLAKKIGISVSILGEMERGNRLPSRIVIEKIADVLQINSSEFSALKVDVEGNDGGGR